MTFLNADPANPSWPAGRGGSSAAHLNLPPGAEVLWAGLYWGARANSSASGRNTIYLKPPGATAYQAVTGTLLGTINISYPPYVAFADVTSLVRSAGSGTYWVGGILAQTGLDNSLGFYAGWSLVVVYRDPSATLKNLVVYDGLAVISSGNSVSITLSGFLTPLSGPVTARVGAVAFEGEGGFTGDQLLLNGSARSDAQNPANNFFNSSISLLGSRLTQKTPDYVNQMAVDVDLLDATGRLPNGATSATVTFTSSGDAYFPAVMAFAVDLYVPDLVTTFTKTASDLNGGGLLVGDLLEYTVSFTNTGQDGAVPEPGQALGVSILTGPFGPVQPGPAGSQTAWCRRFNPHRPFRAGATLIAPVLPGGRVEVSILTGPFGPVQHEKRAGGLL